MKCRKYYVKLAFVCREIYNGIGVIPPYKKDDKNSKIVITSLLRHVTMVPKLNMFHREEKKYSIKYSVLFKSVHLGKPSLKQNEIIITV